MNTITNLESEIVETARNLNSRLFTLYVLTKNSPLEPHFSAYYSELCRSLENLERVIERDSQHSETAANVANAANAVADDPEKDGYPMVLSEDVYKLVLEEEKQKKDFQDTLLAIKENKNPRSKSRTSLKDYMKTLKDFYGEISLKTLKDNYDDSFEIKFYTDKIDDIIISTLEKYKDYEVYDVRCEQYCSLPPIDCRIITLDNRKRKPC